MLVLPGCLCWQRQNAFADPIIRMSRNIITLKWGDRYGPEYVNILHRAVRKHLKGPFEFHCCTEKPEGLDPEIRVIPFPPDPGLKRGWPDVLAKLVITRDGFGGLEGPTLFLDLDVAIMDDMEPFFTYKPGKYCIIHNWASGLRSLTGKRPAVGNSSVFRFEAGKSNEIYETFMREIHRAEDCSIFNTEQAFLTYAMKEAHWWPEEWCRSYKRFCRPIFPLNLILSPKPPSKCRILVFHGQPDPDHAIRGFRGRKIHHRIKPAPWIETYWKL